LGQRGPQLVEFSLVRSEYKLILHMESRVCVYDGTTWTISLNTILFDALVLHSDVTLRYRVTFLSLPQSIARVGLRLKAIVVSLHCIDTLAIRGVFAFIFLFWRAYAALRCPHKVNASNATRFLL